MMIGEKYEVLQILGSGNRGKVYKVYDRGLKRFLAVKEILADNEAEYQNVKREADILKECYHPAIPTVIECLLQEGGVYLVMEWIEGVNLTQYKDKRRKISQKQAMEFALQIGEALEYLHSADKAVIYGDLKPDNIMVTPEGKIRLVDFGTAFYEAEGKQRAEGSYGYAAPEQQKGQKADIRSDIFSFGAILHFLFSGEDFCQPPYHRRRLRECSRSTGRKLERLVDKCLKTEAERRYQDMKTVLGELRACKKNSYSNHIWHAGVGLAEVLLLIAAATGILEAVWNSAEGSAFLESSQFTNGILLLCCAGLWHYLMLGNGLGRGKGYRLEKNIWKTDKKGIGLFLLLFLVCCIGPQSQAASKELLPVEFYDEMGHKVCIRFDVQYLLKGNLRMEIPWECFEEQEITLVHIALENPQTGKEKSRQLQVRLANKRK